MIFTSAINSKNCWVEPCFPMIIFWRLVSKLRCFISKALPIRLYTALFVIRRTCFSGMNHFRFTFSTLALYRIFSVLAPARMELNLQNGHWICQELKATRRSAGPSIKIFLAKGWAQEFGRNSYLHWPKSWATPRSIEGSSNHVLLLIEVAALWFALAIRSCPQITCQSCLSQTWKPWMQLLIYPGSRFCEWAYVTSQSSTMPEHERTWI